MGGVEHRDNAAHEEWVEAYRAKCGGVWHKGPDDGCFFQQLAHHLVQAGRADELYTLLIASPDWMEAKFVTCMGDASTLADLELAIQQQPDLLTLTQLHAARQVIHARVSVFEGSNLAPRVWLERKAKALAREGDVLSRVGTHDEIRADNRGNAQRRMEALGAVASALALVGKVDEALSAVLEIDNPAGQADTLSSLKLAQRRMVVELVQAGNPHAAEVLQKTLTALEANTMRELALETVAATLAMAGKIEEALAVTQGIGNVYKKARALGVVAGALAMAGKVKEVLAVVRGINVKDDYRTGESRAVAAALAQAGHFSEALAVARGTENVWSRANALSSVAAALTRVGDPRGDQIFREALGSARGIESNYGRELVMRAVEEERSQAGKIKKIPSRAEEIMKALATARGIEHAWSRAEAMRDVAVAMARVGDPRAKEVFGEALAVARGIKDARSRAEALRDVAAAMAETGQLDEALAAARGIAGHYDTAVRALRDVVAAMAQAGRFDEALAVVAQDLKYSTSRAHVLRDVAAAMAQAGQFDEALAVAENTQDRRIRAYMLRDVSAAMAQAGQFEEALAVARDIEDAPEQASALWNIAAAMAKDGRFVEALDALGPQEPSGFMRCLAEWAESFEKVEPGLSVAVLREAARIIGWVLPGWRPIYEILAACG